MLPAQDSYGFARGTLTSSVLNEIYLSGSFAATGEQQWFVPSSAPDLSSLLGSSLYYEGSCSGCSAQGNSSAVVGAGISSQSWIASNLPSWDFSSIWKFTSGFLSPVFRWQYNSAPLLHPFLPLQMIKSTLL